MNCDYYNVKHAIAVSNGTVALHLALVALGIGKGDEVIIPNLTFAATANAVIHAGANPVLADIEEESWTIDFNRLDKLISNKTKAIIPVHLYGNPCNMDELIDFADKYKLLIIEDCAEAHGAEFKGKKVGSFGDINCFSFYGNKIITTGEGGICLTNNDDIAKKAKLLRNHGMGNKKKYWHDHVAYNYRMTNIQAGIGCAQISRIDQILYERNKIYNKYVSNLKNSKNLLLPINSNDRKSVCWLFTLLINSSDKEINFVQNELLKKNIETRPMFFPLNIMPPYKNCKKNEQKFSNKISQKGLSLPTFEGLSKSQIDFICNSLLEIIE